MKYIASFLVAIALSSLVLEAEADHGCGGKPADVIFVLDCSGSIWGPDFQKQLDFVSDVIDVFDVSPDMMRVGAISFSNWAYPQFNLSTFQSKSEVLQAVANIRHVRGNTNTASALAFVTDEMFAYPNGARGDVPHVVIVMTDGKSDDSEETLVQAARAHGAGVTVFSIGIGKSADMGELEAIASSPASEHVFTVEGFSALQSIKDKLAIKTCEVTTPPTTTTTEATTTTEKIIPACGDHTTADIVFAPSPSATAANTERALEFYRQVATGLNIDTDKVHVGMVPKNCRLTPEITLNMPKNQAMNMLDDMMEPEADTADVIRYMRQYSFSHHQGARHDAKSVGVIIVEETGDLTAARQEAARARSLQGVELFVIGVGSDVNPFALQTLATSTKHIFHVSSYEGLSNYIDRLSDAICPGSSLR